MDLQRAARGVTSARSSSDDYDRVMPAQLGSTTNADLNLSRRFRRADLCAVVGVRPDWVRRMTGSLIYLPPFLL